VIASPRVRPRMRSRPRRIIALAAAAAIALPVGGGAQEKPVPAGEAAAGPAGSWVGWAKLVNDWPGPPCRYEGPAAADSVRLELTPDGATLRGSVAIDLPAEPGADCPPLRKRYAIAESVQGPGTLSFTDSGGNDWTLAVRRGGSVLQGLLAWRQGGPDQPLAEGFARPDGQRPTARLSGEVRLRRVGEEEPGTKGAAPAAEAPATEAPAAEIPAAEAPGAPPPKPIGAGGHARNVGIVLGANVVGLGLLYGVNKLGKGSSEAGVVTCSPRVCVVGAPNQPCFCEGNVLSGAPCGTTTAGAPLGTPCDGRSVPCQSGLSCNSGICEDRDGRCPY
jgi:hypothetical protein